MYRIICLVFVLSRASAQPIIQVPPAGNCGDDTVLICKTTGYVVNWKKNTAIIVSNGNQVDTAAPVKYIQTSNTATSVLLTIKNTQITDGDTYTCGVNFDNSPAKTLQFECKAKTANDYVAQNKKLTIDIQGVYPSPAAFAVHVGTPLVGSYSCSISSTIPSYFDCIWTSTSSIEDGEHTYSVNVTTFTTSIPITGTLKIITPSAPTISNKETISSNGQAVRGTENKSMTITCTSTGGIPAPTLAWYRTSISTTPLASPGTGILQGDGTYTVTLSYTFTSDRPRDDLKLFLCRSYYPQATTTVTQGSRISSVLMYLYLKPSTPTLTQTNTPTPGGTVTVECRTTNCRPAAAITFTYNGQNTTPDSVETSDTNTETFTVVSTFQKSVTATDNGNNVKCSVTHRALDNALEQNTDISVRFPVSSGSTSITGNIEFTATGTARLTLTCTTGSSNPASDLTWRNGSTVITSARPYTPSSGANNGIIISQELWLYPDRYMHGNTIICSVANVVTQTAVVDSVNLNLRYHPIVSTTTPLVVTEGDTNSYIPCSADSRPACTFTWYRDNTQIDQASPGTDRYNYNFGTVNRAHYGQYKCRADNGVSPTSEAQISVQIRFKPNTVSITGNQVITANNINTLTLTCNSGTSNPIASLSWNVGNVPVVRYNDLNDLNGDYGGKINRQQVIIKPTRDHDGATVTCTSSNQYNVNNPASNSETLNLNYNPVIKSIFANEPTEGQTTPARLRCEVTSKPASSFKWFKGNALKEQSNGAVSNNVYEHVIANVNRGHAGTYRCETNNNINPKGTATVDLVVKYTPDVTVTTTNTTVNANSVDIVCSPSGVPNTYSYQPWTQYWSPDVEIIHTPGLANNPTLHLSQLSYQHSGIYTCTAGNGVLASNNPEAGSGRVRLLVKSQPIVTEPAYNNGDHHKLSIALNTPSSLVLEYYSDAGDTTVTVNSKIGGNIGTNVFTVGPQTPTNVQLPVFTQTVTTLGINTTLTFTISNQQQFGQYEVVLRNDNDLPETLFIVAVAPKQPPEVPYHMTSANVTQTTATLTWVRGFHGGSDQTFVVQLSQDNIQWTNKTFVDDGQKDSNTTVTVTIDGLIPGTTYHVRVFAFNQEGHNDEYSNVHDFNTDIVETNEQTSSLGGVIGGTIAGVVVILLVVVAVVLARRYDVNLACKCTCKKKIANPDTTQDSKTYYENVTENKVANTQGNDASEQVSYYNIGRESEPVPSTYETISDREPTPNMYSSIQNIEMATSRHIVSDTEVSEPIQSQYESLTDREASPNMYSSLDNTDSSPGGDVTSNPGHVYYNLKV